MSDRRIINGKLRLWYGVTNPIPQKLKDSVIGFCILKPDLIERDLKKEVLLILAKDLYLHKEKSFFFNKELIFELYPGFHEPEWAENLINYLVDRESCALLFNGRDVINQLMNLRNYIRKLYGKSEGGIINLIHASDSSEDAIREALLIFKEEDIIDASIKKIK